RLVGPFPRFGQRVVDRGAARGGPAWVDDPEFSLDRHVHGVRLAAPGDMRALQRFVGARIGVPLDRSRPLWEAHTVDSYEDGGALLMRMHHCIADGVALTQVLLSMIDEDVIDEDVDAGWAPAHPPEGGGLTRVVGELLHVGAGLLPTPRRVLRLPGLTLAGATTAVDVAAATRRLVLSLPDPGGALRGPLTSGKAVRWVGGIRLDDLKAAGAAAGCTINDVVTAALAGGLHRYLVAHGGLAHDLRALVPINLRPLDRPLPAELGNRFGLVLLDLPVREAHRRRRLATVRRRMSTLKSGADGVVAYTLLDLMGRAPLHFERTLVSFFSSKATLVLTNVPGPRQPVRLAGATVRGYTGWPPQSGGMGLGISVFSYAGEVTVGVMADRDVVAHPDALVTAIRAELDDLLAELTAGS
ncbi:MAG TPA: wax ester/triacylglycerol synthase family O-acyltransferase, partial [Frankiaceae bacterium]|nr:wax ester/triacylglycerol synthase family O-acyltransferase [Frankiaceae bacterium]